MIRARHKRCFPGQRKAALVSGLRSVRFYDLRVDEHIRMLVADIHNTDPLQNAYLRACQTDAVCLVHRLKHIVDQLADPGRDLLHGSAFLFQYGIPLDPNFT